MNPYVNELLKTLQTSKPVVWQSTGADFWSQQPTLCGYAVVWNTTSVDKGGYRLRYRLETFFRDILRQSSLPILVDHDAQTRVGDSFLLDCDSFGLWLEATGNGCQSSRLWWKAINSGELATFSIGASSVHGTSGIVETKRGRLHEISLTRWPAMPSTVARLRDHWPNAERLKDLLVISNASLESLSDDEYVNLQAAKAVLRLCEVNRERIPPTIEALRRRVELYHLAPAA